MTDWGLKSYSGDSYSESNVAGMLEKVFILSLSAKTFNQLLLSFEMS